MSKDLGFKVLFISVLSVVLMIPLILIDGLIAERSQYRYQVENEIADTWSGAQAVIGPVLAVPYQVRRSEQVWDEQQKEYRTQIIDSWYTQYVMPEQLDVDTKTQTEERSRGIYSVPVYTSELTLNGRFAGFALNQHRQEMGEVAAMGAPFLVLSVTDLRGLGSSPDIDWQGSAIYFEPGTQMTGLNSGMHAKLPDIGNPETFAADFNITFQLRGSQSLQLVAVGKQTIVDMQSAWPHPRFFGHFLPITRDISDSGFSARWDVSAFATNALDKFSRCSGGDCYDLMNSAFGVDYVQPVDVYTKSERAIKYGILFIVLTFAAFFLIELTGSLRLHIVQYGLAGCALAMFYLLLLSLSEHMPFVSAYLIANMGCCGLLGMYLSSAMQSRGKGWGYAGCVSLLYWMLYAILRSEDFALLMGCLLLFAALAVVMLLTRKIDWYQVGQRLSPTPRQVSPDETAVR